MTSSSFKNAFQGKAHRERSQPSARANMGLLEKKKDYLLRAKNYHGKEKRLKALRWKALNRNPDEFYYNMVSSQTRKGVHWLSRQENYDAGTIALLKRKDSNYIRMHNQLQKKKLDKLMENHLHDISGIDGVKRQHTVFIDDEDDAEDVDDDAEEDNAQGDNAQEDNAQEEKAEILKERKRRLEEFLDRSDRLKKLDIVDREYELQRKLNAKGQKYKVGVDADGIPIYKWRNQRKK